MNLRSGEETREEVGVDGKNVNTVLMYEILKR